MNEELKKKYLEKIKECNNCDEEMGHVYADQALCELLRELGFDEIVEAYNKIGKWYA